MRFIFRGGKCNTLLQKKNTKKAQHVFLHVLGIDQKQTAKEVFLHSLTGTPMPIQSQISGIIFLHLALYLKRLNPPLRSIPNLAASLPYSSLKIVDLDHCVCQKTITRLIRIVGETSNLFSPFFSCFRTLHWMRFRWN